MNLLSLVNKTIKEDANQEQQIAGGVNTDAQASVSADNMSLNIQNTLTHAEVAGHLKAADEAAEEVETVTFGLETDDGAVIKVYVAVPDADNFEKALAKKLGEEDDIEQVLDDLADQFDIVDVKWPEEESNATETFAADNEEKDEVVHDIEQDQPDNNEKEQAEDDLNAEIGDGDSNSDEDKEKKGGIDTSGDDTGEEKKGGIDTSSEEDPLETDSDDSPLDNTDDDKEKKGGLDKGGEEESPLDDSDEDDEDESPLEDDSEEDEDKDKPKKGGLNKNKKEGEKMEKKGGLKKESAELSLIKYFITEEIRDNKTFDDPVISKLHQEVPTRQQKLIIEVLSVLGVPGDILKLRHSTFKHNLKIAGEMVLENTHLRIWMQKFVDAAMAIKHDDHKFHSPFDKKVDDATTAFAAKSSPVNTAESLMSSVIGKKLLEKEDPAAELGAESTDVEDILKIQIHNRIAAMALAIVAKLGVDDEIVRSRRFSVKRSVTLAAKRIAKSTRAKMALLMVAGALGIAKDPHASHIILPHETDPEKEVEESVEIPDSSHEEKLGATIYAESVHRLLLALGIPESQLDFQNTALRASINNKKKSIKHMNRVMTRINHLIDALNEVDEGYDESDEISKAELMTGRHKKTDENAPADLGEWDIAVIDDTIVLKVEDFKITIDMGEEGLDKVLDAMADGDVASVKCDGKRITFRPTNRGRDYVVKEFGNTKYPNGILLNQKSIDEIADAI